MTLAMRYNEALLEAARLLQERNELLRRLKLALRRCAGWQCFPARPCDKCANDLRIIEAIESQQ